MSRKYQTPKTRPEAFEQRLSSAQLSSLREVCTKKGFARAAEFARENIKIKLSVRSLHRWYHKDDAEMVLASIATGAHLNAVIAESFQTNPAPDMATLVNMIKKLVMQMAVEGETNPALLELSNTLFKSALDYVKEEGKNQDRARDERRLVLLEKKAAQATATEKVLTDADLSPAERAQRIQEIYGR